MTLVEVLVALVVLSVAALGAAAVLGYSARAQHRAVAIRAALDAVRARASAVTASECGALTSGGDSVGGIPLRWDVERDSLRAAITMTGGRPGAAVTLRTEVPCV